PIYAPVFTHRTQAIARVRRGPAHPAKEYRLSAPQRFLLLLRAVVVSSYLILQGSREKKLILPIPWTSKDVGETREERGHPICLLDILEWLRDGRTKLSFVYDIVPGRVFSKKILGKPLNKARERAKAG
ncbi:MAG: hypothetical protein K0R47_4240, partial [Brevibacillus sp.]|nr:hypothetical protein [Brevibacillus sp.]